jgi:hypothetical protein
MWPTQNHFDGPTGLHMGGPQFDHMLYTWPPYWPPHGWPLICSHALYLASIVGVLKLNLGGLELMILAATCSSFSTLRPTSWCSWHDPGMVEVNIVDLYF